jgi:hypothetical protein
MKKFCMAVFGAWALFAASCEKVVGEGPVVTETRTTSGFNGLDLRMSGNLYFTRDTAYKIEVSGQRNILDKLETFVSNGKLVLKFKDKAQIRSHEDVTIVVFGPELNEVRVSGSGNITTTNAIAPGSMDLDISGSGGITLAVVTSSYISGSISGSGNIKILSGTITEEKIKISGSGNADLSAVSAVKASSTTSGSGNIWLQVSDVLNVTISGSGSVHYKGSPVINTYISGSGSVVHM